MHGECITHHLRCECGEARLRHAIRGVLLDALMVGIKEDDEQPASAEQHLCRAVARLIDLCPDWDPPSEEMRQQADYCMDVAAIRSDNLGGNG